MPQSVVLHSISPNLPILLSHSPSSILYPLSSSNYSSNLLYPFPLTSSNPIVFPKFLLYFLSMDNTSKPDPKLLIIIAVVLILLISAFGGTLYFYLQYKKAQDNFLKLSSNPTEVLNMENKNMLEKVRSLMVLPDEDPQIGILTDQFLKQNGNQPFFAQAKTGDWLFIFNNAKKAVLYDPIANKIVEVGPVNTSTPSGQLNPQNNPPSDASNQNIASPSEQSNPPQPKEPSPDQNP